MSKPRTKTAVASKAARSTTGAAAHAETATTKSASTASASTPTTPAARDRKRRGAAAHAGAARAAASALHVAPLTRARWPDLVALFGARGACGGCWCMWWSLKRADWVAGKGESNRRAFERIVAGGAEPGLIAYAGREPVGWCALGPREDYAVLARSRTLKPVDDRPTWAITCFFIDKRWRRRGVSKALLEAAAAHARARGAARLEGYPVDPRASMPDAFAWTGTLRAFEQTGFREIARRAATRPIVRRELC